MKRLFTRIFVLLAVVEVVYLAAVNVVLNLPSTQDYLNRLQPDRFAVQWDRAWSWYPFRVHVTSLSVNGQTWSQQWQVSGPEATASLAILPLLQKTVRIKNLNTADLDVRFRPRPHPDSDDAAARQFYPTIEGRDPSLVAEPVPTTRPGWLVVVDIGRISGRNSFWVRQVRGTLSGNGRATVTHKSGHGPLTISNGETNASIETLSISGQQISTSGSAIGTFEAASFIPHENRGMKSLAFVSADAEIELPLADLDFLNFYLGKVSGMTLAGIGTLKGRFAYALGDLIAGTDLAVSAESLTVEQEPYALSGAGNVDVKVHSSDPGMLDATFHFDTLSASVETEDGALFSGGDVAVTVERMSRILPTNGDGNSEHRRIVVTIPAMTVPDLSAYQRYLPDKWDVHLLGGTGTLEGRAALSATSMEADLTLASERAEIRAREDSFETNLSIGLKLVGEADTKTARVDATGSFISLNETRVKDLQGEESEKWQARLVVKNGGGEFDLPDAANIDGEPIGFLALAKDKDLRALLATVDGALTADISVSDLDWLNILFKNPYSLAVHNSAEIEADLTVRSGWFSEGSTLRMEPRDFNVEVLDYVAEGIGGFSVAVERGGKQPDLRLEAQLKNASLKLKDEKTAVIDHTTLAVTALAKGVSFKGGGTVETLGLSVSSAKVTDMSSYNHYLPASSPLRLLGGEADLTADIQMEAAAVTGFVKLQASRIEALFDDQKLMGTLIIDADINDGTVQDMAFDISGTSLVLNDVQVVGERSQAAGRVWNGRIDLKKGRVVWKKPMALDFDVRVQMTDTRPLIAMFENHRKKHKWLERILTLEDVRGDATIRIKGNEFLVPYALAKSKTIEVGAKGVIRDKDREGIFYVRYGKLAGALEIDNGERVFKLIGATKKFEEYVPGK